jgi:hypothetical protein
MSFSKYATSRGLSANKGEGIITIGARGEITASRSWDKIFLDDIAWTSNLSHVKCVMSMHRNGPVTADWGALWKALYLEDGFRHRGHKRKT